VRTETRVSNSRFIATIAPAASVEAARAFIQSVREEMPDATHHVYAMRIGGGASVTDGMSDDGEPSGTSGPPVLAALRGSGLGDAVVVVTRYFGGTKLGTGGLVSAYGEAARAILAIAETEEKVERATLAFSAPYALYQPIRQAVEAVGGRIEAEEFAGDVALEVGIPVEEVEAFRGAVRDLSGGRVDPAPPPPA